MGDLSEFSGELTAPPSLFLHNLQATLLIGFFGLFSFGVLGVILYLVNTSVIGGLLGTIQINGLRAYATCCGGHPPARDISRSPR